MHQERALAIDPIVQESVQRNTRTITNIRNLTASLFGIAAGTLGLESYVGFLFYAVGTLFVSLLIYLGPAHRNPETYFYSPGKSLWMSDVFGGLMSFVLTWTVFYGIAGAY